MKKRTFLILLLFLLISCAQKNKNEDVYKNNTKDIILYDNAGIKNLEAKEFFNNGLKSIEAENYAKAKEDFIAADKIENYNPMILNAIAEVESRLGDDKKSNKILQNILSIDSTYLPTYINLGRNYSHNKQYEKAKNIYLKGIKYISDKKLHTKSTLFLNLSLTYTKLGDCKNGLKYSTEALKFSQNKVLSKYAAKIILRNKQMCKSK
jgi:Tfp pilus assembly protein PilF